MHAVTDAFPDYEPSPIVAGQVVFWLGCTSDFSIRAMTESADVRACVNVVFTIWQTCVR